MRKPKSRRESKRFVPQLRLLEQRTVPAGNVTAAVIGGYLVVNGDDAGNQIFVGQPGKYTAGITALDNTTINGQASATFDGVYNGYIIMLGGGDDVLAVIGDVAGGSLAIDMGEGNNAVTLGMVTSYSGASITTGSGADSVSLLGSTFYSWLNINTGAGDDRINASFSTFDGDTIVDGGAGNNLLSYDNISLGQLPVVRNFQASSGGPTANNDTATVAQGGTTQINVAANDAAGARAIDPASIRIVSVPSFGTATANANGTITYVNTGASTSDSFTYTISDTAGNVSNIATVNISITNSAGFATTIATTTGDPTKSNPFQVIVTFAQDVATLPASALQVTNGTIGTITKVDARTFFVNVAPVDQGLVSVLVKAGAVTGTNGTNAASTTLTRVYDSIAPVLTINPLVTNEHTPTITGTIDDPDRPVTVTVNGQTFNATVTGNNWSAVVPDDLPNGTYTVVASGSDAAGNLGTATLTDGLVVDLIPPGPPTVTLDPSSDSGIADDGITNDATPTFTGSAEAGATVEVFANGGSGSVSLGTTVATGGTWTLTSSITLADGNYAVTAVATDAAGNIGPSSTVLNITINTVAPTATLTTTANDPTNTAPLTFTVTFSTDVTGFSLAGVNVVNGDASNLTTVNARTYTFDVQPTGQGLVTVTVNAGAAQDAVTGTDNEASNPLSLTYDSDAPAATITSLTTNSTTPTIAGTVDDSTAAISVTVNGQTVAGVVNGTNWTAALTTALAEGTYDVSATATDTAGNSATTTLTNGLVIDLTNPLVTINASSTGAITGTASDALSGVAGVSISISNGTLFWDGTAFASSTEVFVPTTSSDNFATWTLNFAAGTYTVRAQSTDVAGNLSTIASVSVTVS